MRKRARFVSCKCSVPFPISAKAICLLWHFNEKRVFRPSGFNEGLQSRGYHPPALQLPASEDGRYKSTPRTHAEAARGAPGGKRDESRCWHKSQCHMDKKR